MKRILIVSYHFPPSDLVGSIRPEKFAKFLPDYGWRPYVLTIQERHIVSTDPARLHNTGKYAIHRTAVYPTPLELAVKTKQWLTARLFKPSHPTGTPTVPPAQTTRQPHGLAMLQQHITRYLSSFFELPDKEVGWVIPAVLAGYRLIKREHIEVIFTTSPPTTAALVGWLLALLTGKKLVTDLRDPWILHDRKPRDVRSAFSDLLERALEKQITKRSAHILTTTEHYTELLRKKYPARDKNTFCTLWNGYDRDDFHGVDPTKKRQDKFTMSYLGTFYYGRTPKEFLQALAELCRDKVLRQAEIQVNFIGFVRYAEGLDVEALIQTHGLQECVTIHDVVSHAESIQQMSMADMLLLFAPEQYYQIPLKTFEYIGANRPILCFAKAGATADLISMTNSGCVVDPYDIEDIKKAIRHFYTLWKTGQGVPTNNNAQLFERRHLTRLLAEILSTTI